MSGMNLKLLNIVEKIQSLMQSEYGCSCFIFYVYLAWSNVQWLSYSAWNL